MFRLRFLLPAASRKFGFASRAYHKQKGGLCSGTQQGAQGFARRLPRLCPVVPRSVRHSRVRPQGLFKIRLRSAARKIRPRRPKDSVGCARPKVECRAGCCPPRVGLPSGSTNWRFRRFCICCPTAVVGFIRPARNTLLLQSRATARSRVF